MTEMLFIHWVIEKYLKAVLLSHLEFIVKHWQLLNSITSTGNTFKNIIPYHQYKHQTSLIYNY